MSPEEFRIHVQQALFKDRKTRDVAFEPLEGGLERVYFWDQGVRANFLIDTNKIKGVQQLGLAVKASADQSHEAAKVQAVKDAEEAAAEAARLLETENVNG